MVLMRSNGKETLPFCWTIHNLFTRHRNQKPRLPTMYPCSYSIAGFAIAMFGLFIITFEPRPENLSPISRLARIAFYLSTVYYLLVAVFIAPVIHAIPGHKISDLIVRVDVLDGDEFNGAIAYGWQYISGFDYEMMPWITMMQIGVFCALLSVSLRGKAKRSSGFNAMYPPQNPPPASSPFQPVAMAAPPQPGQFPGNRQ